MTPPPPPLDVFLQSDWNLILDAARRAGWTNHLESLIRERLRFLGEDRRRRWVNWGPNAQSAMEAIVLSNEVALLTGILATLQGK